MLLLYTVGAGAGRASNAAAPQPPARTCSACGGDRRPPHQHRDQQHEQHRGQRELHRNERIDEQSRAVTGIAVLTTRSACGRIATSHTPIRNTAIGIVYANDAHGASSALSPPSTSISTSMPAEKEAAAAKMK